MSKSTSIAEVDERPLSFASAEFDNATYELVAQSASLRQVSLANSQFSIKVPAFMNAEEEGADLRPAFRGEPKHQSYMPTSGMLIGSYYWTVDVKVGRVKALKMSAEYVLIYSGLSNAPEEYVKLYFAKLGRFTSYPYFRSLLAMNVSAAGVSIPPLPSLKDRVD